MTAIPRQIHKDTKTNIFFHAARLFAQKGYNGVSMREISERSGVSKPTIYYYFGSKEGIYKELLEEGIRHCTGHFKEIQSMPIPSKEKLVLIVKALFDDALRYPDITRFFINLFMISESPDFLDSYHTEAVDQTQVIIELIREGVRSGEFAPDIDPVLVADILVGTIAHMIWHQMMVRKRILTDLLSEAIVQSIVYGIHNGKPAGGIDAIQK